MMRKQISSVAVMSAALFLSGCMTGGMSNGMAMGSDNVAYVGGAAMYPTKTIVENAMQSPVHTTLVAAVKAAGLVDTLSGAGPFTVFAPTDTAFAKLPAGTVETLTMPQNKAQLTSILTYHVVAGRVSAADLMAKIRAGGGRATLTTVQGESLVATMMNGMVMLTDTKGNMAHVTQGDVMQSNGVIHVIDTVLMP